MKIIIAFYSLSGVTRKVCHKLADKLKALGNEVAVEDIIDHKKRTGLIGYIAAGKDAIKKNRTDIDPPKNNPADFDLLILAMPVWTFTLPPAIRTYIEMNLDNLPKKVAAICTQGNSGDERTYNEIEKIIDQELCMTVTFIDKNVKKEVAEKFDKPLDDFIDMLEL